MTTKGTATDSRGGGEGEGEGAAACSGAGWCSLSFRFDGAELQALRQAEQAWGAYLAARSTADELPTALALARAGRKLAQAGPGLRVELPETELRALLRAVRFSAGPTEPPPSPRLAALAQRFVGALGAH